MNFQTLLKKRAYLFRVSLLMIAVTCFAGCQSEQMAEKEQVEAIKDVKLYQITEPHRSFIEPIEAAHGKQTLLTKEVFKCDIRLTTENFAENVFKCQLRMTVTGDKIRMDYEDGSSLYWDGSSAWVYPSACDKEDARFDLLTWSYFILAPFKLRDPGTHMEMISDGFVFGTAYPRAKLTFSGEVGDTPDDWYVVYRHPKFDTIKGLGYIVTYGTSVEEAGKETHGVTYERYRSVGDYTPEHYVLMPTIYNFWKWSEQGDFQGLPHNSLEVSNMEFQSYDPEVFKVPDDVREDVYPK